MEEKIDLKNVETSTSRIHGSLYEIVKVKDDEGQVVRTFQIPLKVEIKIKDVLQIIVGSSILAVPVAFTTEVWDMGHDLPWANVIALAAVGFVFLASFIYFSAYRNHMKMYGSEFLVRVLASYLLSLLVVGFLLTIVSKCPWFSDFDVALKRTMIGAFPASMSATVTDSLS
jgi:uncharacterized membrane protein